MRRILGTMRAIRVSQFGGPEVLKLEQNMPIPQPKDDQVVIQVKAAGVNPIEAYIRSGAYGPKPTPNFALPWTPGADAAGIVTAVGSNAHNVKVGDRVFACDSFGSGSYSEYMAASAVHVHHLPESLSFSQGAGLGIPYFTALRALRHKANAKAGETLLVHGASGGVGLAACQIASAWGLDVTGTASTDEGMELVKKAGAKRVLNHKKPNYLDELKNVPGWKGFNVILEMLANVNLVADMEAVATEGRIVIIGSRGKIEIDPRALMNTDASVTGMKMWDATPDQWKEMAKDLKEGFDGQWVQPIIDEEFKLEDAPKAHEAVMAHSSGAKGKIVLLV